MFSFGAFLLGVGVGGAAWLMCAIHHMKTLEAKAKFGQLEYINGKWYHIIEQNSLAEKVNQEMEKRIENAINNSEKCPYNTKLPCSPGIACQDCSVFYKAKGGNK